MSHWKQTTHSSGLKRCSGEAGSNMVQIQRRGTFVPDHTALSPVSHAICFSHTASLREIFANSVISVISSAFTCAEVTLTFSLEDYLHHIEFGELFRICYPAQCKFPIIGVS